MSGLEDGPLKAEMEAIQKEKDTQLFGEVENITAATRVLDFLSDRYKYRLLPDHGAIGANLSQKQLSDLAGDSTIDPDMLSERLDHHLDAMVSQLEKVVPELEDYQQQIDYELLKQKRLVNHYNKVGDKLKQHQAKAHNIKSQKFEL